MASDSTNLASEFFVLSQLHRLGANATLTLAHHKSVDIVVVRGAGRARTVDVKAAATRDWFIDNLTQFEASHFIVFVCYLNRINDLTVDPEVYIVPSRDVPGLTYTAPGGKKVVRLTRLRNAGNKYRDRWNRLV